MSTTLRPPTLADLRAAQARLAGIARVTPVMSSETLSRLVARPVSLKAENLQRTGAFKIRGAYNTVAQLGPAERRAGVVTASAGNHGQAVAWAAREAGIPATIFVPETAPMAKVDAARSYGARVELAGEGFDEAADAARAFETETGATFVHAFEDARVIAGQGTIALEMLEEVGDLDVLVVDAIDLELLAGGDHPGAQFRIRLVPAVLFFNQIAVIVPLRRHEQAALGAGHHQAGLALGLVLIEQIAGVERRANLFVQALVFAGNVVDLCDAVERATEQQPVDGVGYHQRGEVVADQDEVAEGAEWLRRIEEENAGEMTPEKIAAMEAEAARIADDITAPSAPSEPAVKLSEEASPTAGRRFTRT